MAWQYYPGGKDTNTQPGVEIDEESFHTMDEIIIALIKALIKKGAITRQQLLDEL